MNNKKRFKDKRTIWLSFRYKQKKRDHAGFTLTEILVSSSIMLVVILGALAFYARSNRVTVDQQQYAELQHDVRSAMYLLTRDIRMAGVGLPEEFFLYALEGVNNEDQGGEVKPDRIRILGNLEDPLNLTIDQYQGGQGGGAVNIKVNDGSFEQYPYPLEFYDDKIVLILPNPKSSCRTGTIRKITHVIWNAGGTNEGFNTSPGLAPGMNPPGGLTADSPCSPDDFDGGLVMFVNVKEFWLDVTGKYPNLTPGVKGYLGEPGVLYMTNNGIHYPLAQNIENFQLEYNGDLDDDGFLDGFKPWDENWTDDQITRIRQVRIYLLGRTPNRFVSVSGQVPKNIFHYRRPGISDSPGTGTDDYHRRFLLETTVNIRNLNLNLYNTGQR
jgi:prepilin-type N-terminal cleavage/methylation domain-containing protein